MSVHSLQHLAKNISNKRWMNEFTQGEKIGKGGFASVYKAKHNFDENHYAVKKIKIAVDSLKGTIQEELEQVLIESKFLARVNHDNILKCYNSWVEIETKPKELAKPQYAKNKGGWREMNADDDEDSACASTYDSLGDSDSSTMVFDRSGEDESEDNHFIFEEKIEGSQDTVEQGSKGPSIANSLDEAIYNNKSVKILDPVLEALSTGLTEDETIDKVMFFIQTELCKETLGDYIANRNKKLGSMQARDPEGYKQAWKGYVEEAIAFAKQILEGIAYIHSEGIIHRDLKPQNVFLLDKVCKIGDFGLIKISDSLKAEVFGCTMSEHHDECEASLGTPSRTQESKSKKSVSGGIGTKLFASPEQWEGEDEKVDFKADIYSLGIVLLLLFHPMGTTMEELQVISESKKGNLPSKLEQELPEVAEIIKKMLVVDPNDRPSLEIVLSHLKA